VKISVVIPSYNQGAFVGAALRSVIEQDYPDKEILFIDGGSTDSTMTTVESYKDEITYSISEPDSGQSDALEKGFARATGDVLTWLSTDDLLLPGALSEVADTFRRHSGCEWVLGNVVWIDATGRILESRRGERYSAFTGPRIGLLTSCGPSAFFSRALYDRVGRVNRDLHFMMDTELWWRFAMSGAKFRRLKRYTWALRLHESAKTSGHLFALTDDPKRAMMADAQRAEHDHIERLTQPYRVQIPRAISRSVHIARRLSSIGYLIGRYESWAWRGRNIDDVFGVKC
jgi:glycosyltransferase involved in cell wall biosynthesis